MAEIITKEDILFDEVAEFETDTSDGLELVVHNDDVNTFDWVIESLIDVCKHSSIQAEQCTLLIHFKGKAGVQHGNKTKLQPMQDGLIDRGINASIN